MIEFGINWQKFAEDAGGMPVGQASAEFCLKKLQLRRRALSKQGR